MKTTTAYSLLALATAATALPSPVHKRACDAAVKLDASSNVFKQYTLHANSFYRGEVDAAIPNLKDTSLAEAAKKVGDVGSFLWLYVRSRSCNPSKYSKILIFKLQRYHREH